MVKIVAYLDCGCAVYENGERAVCPTCEAQPVMSGTGATPLTIHDIVRAALDEFSGAHGVSDEDIAAFLTKLGVTERIIEIAIAAMEASMAELVLEVKHRLLARQSVGEAYEEGNRD